MKQLLIAISLVSLLLVSCKETPDPGEALNALARKYVRLGLNIGQYDPDFVDAYYGPDSLRPVTPAALVMPKDSLLKAVEDLKKELATFSGIPNLNDTLKMRADWITGQLVAFGRRIKIFSGENRGRFRKYRGYLVSKHL